MPTAPASAEPMSFYEAPTTSGQVALDMHDIEGRMGPAASGQQSIEAASGGGGGGDQGGGGGFHPLAQELLASSLPPSATSVVSAFFKTRDTVLPATRGYVDIYAWIDGLRPFFDVETGEVWQRLKWSFHPRKGSMLLKQYDLYTPLTLAFTLAAVLLLGMKAAHAAARLDGQSTLIGTSLGAAFTLWLLPTLGVYTASHLLPGVPAHSRRLVPLACATGYALCGVLAPLALRLLVGSSLACWGATLSVGLASAATLGRTLAATLAADEVDLVVDRAASPYRSAAVVLGLLAGGVNVLGTLFLEWRYLQEVAPPAE